MTEQRMSGLEVALQSSRVAALVLLVVVPVACWTWIIVMARDMYGGMSGASRWMMTASWDVAHVTLLWVMWTVMMIGMMLPTAAPLVLLYGAAARRQPGGRSTAPVYALAGGYVAVWVLFSVAATALQRLLAHWLILSPMMQLTMPAAIGVLLVAAGVYQFTPLKHACLRACQSPLGFMMTRWRSGMSGAFRLGLEHGVFCLGCCWMLMLLLFAGGVMNLTVIAAITGLVAVEKSGIFGRWGTMAAGALLVVMGVLAWREVL